MARRRTSAARSTDLGSKKGFGRRRFLAGGAAAAGALLAAPAAARAPLAAGEKLRVALIGVGQRGSRILEELLAEPAYVDVIAVCDLDEGARRRAVERVEKAGGRAPAAPADYRKLLEDSAIDAVFSATPVDQHYRISMDAIAAGKHLYGEKPMAMTVKECNDIVAVKEKHPRIKVQIGFQRRASARFIEGVKLLREDRILGPLLEGRAAFNNSWAPWGHGEEGSWFGQRARSGDWMIEQAVHVFDVLNWVAGALPLKAFGLGNREVFKARKPARDVTDLYAAILEYPENLIIQYSHSWISPPDRLLDGAYTRFLGLEGAMDIDEGRILYSPRSAKGKREQLFQQDLPNDTTLSIRSFLDALRHDRKPLATVEHGRDASLTGLLVRRAVDERRVVTMDEIAAGS